MGSNTLSNLTFWTARSLKVTYEGVATGGSTVSIIDATYRANDAADIWNLGDAWLLYDAGGAAAAPQGEYSMISDFAGGTISLTTAFTSATSVGDRYAIAKKRYPLQDLIGAVNETILGLGPIEITDITTVDLTASTKEYSLPDVPNCQLKEVWIQGQTGITGDNAYYPVHDYYVYKSATGTANKVIFANAYPIDRAVKLVYTGLHNSLTAYSSEVDDSIDPRLIYLKAAANLLERRIIRVGDYDKSMSNLRNSLLQEWAEARVDTPKKRVSKKPRYLCDRGSGDDEFPSVEALGNV